jgi:hypothetical protein
MSRSDRLNCSLIRSRSELASLSTTKAIRASSLLRLSGNITATTGHLPEKCKRDKTDLPKENVIFPRTDVDHAGLLGLLLSKKPSE